MLTSNLLFKTYELLFHVTPYENSLHTSCNCLHSKILFFLVCDFPMLTIELWFAAEAAGQELK